MIPQHDHEDDILPEWARRRRLRHRRRPVRLLSAGLVAVALVVTGFSSRSAPEPAARVTAASLQPDRVAAPDTRVEAGSARVASEPDAMDPSFGAPRESPTSTTTAEATPSTAADEPEASAGPATSPRADVRAAHGPAAGRSVHGVYRGGSDPAAVAAFERWRGAEVDYVLDFVAGESWGTIGNPSWVANRWAGSGYTVVYSVPMLPPGPFSLADGAAGRYDQHWRNFGRTMVAADQGDAILRLGWEMNGHFFPWAAPGKERHFAAYFRRIVDQLRAVPGTDFRFDWAPLAGSQQGDVEAMYPGDGHVDFIGLDAYDLAHGRGDNAEERWETTRTQRYGLEWQRDFARRRGKPMSIPEWGVTGQWKDAFGDNPDYIRRMLHWIESNDYAYALYFELAAQDGNHRLMTGELPRSGQAYLDHFRR